MSVVLIDADILSYKIGFSCEHESEAEAARTLSLFIETLIYEKLDVEKYELFLTGKGNFRYEIAKTAEYKGNRKDFQRPVHLPFLRDYMVDVWSAKVSEGEEADDLIAIRATELGEDECIIASIDKDFLQIPGWHYNFNKDVKKRVSAHEGLLFFYSQILTGDRADNIPGAYRVGPVKAAKILSGASTEIEMYQRCVEILGKERVLENGRLLWLRRKVGELWTPPSLETEEGGQKADSTNSSKEDSEP